MPPLAGIEQRIILQRSHRGFDRISAAIEDRPSRLERWIAFQPWI